MPEEYYAKRIAVFIDAENFINEISKTDIPFRLSTVIERIKEEGQVVSMRAYADWSQPGIAAYLSEFRNNVVEMTELSVSAYGKNTGDVQLAVDALEMVLSTASPDMLVIISGDRDFVPLVQKAKRYGKTVIGIGITEDSTSQLLATACNLFLYVEDIHRQTTAAPSQTSSVRPAEESKVAGPSKAVAETAIRSGADDILDDQKRLAFSMLARAVKASGRQGIPPTGASINNIMRQISPINYPDRLGYRSFGEFALSAQHHGYARITREDWTADLVFDLKFEVDPALITVRDPEYDYDDPASARKAYEDILRTYKHVELMPWEDRQEIVTQIWDMMEANKDNPVRMGDIINEMSMFARARRPWILQQAIEKLVQSLCISRSFSSPDGVPRIINPDYRIYPALGLEDALFEMHRAYLFGISMSVASVKFTPEAVALFLFGEMTDDTVDEARKLLISIGVSADDGDSTIKIAFENAKKRFEAEDIQ